MIEHRLDCTLQRIVPALEESPLDSFIHDSVGSRGWGILANSRESGVVDHVGVGSLIEVFLV